MLEVKTGEKMDEAIQRAKGAKLFVQATGFREYRVTNRETGTAYAVNFFVAAGKKYSDCSCKAGINGQLCKHVAAALGWHVVRAAEIAAAQSPAATMDSAPMIRRQHQTQPQKVRGVAI